MSALAVSKYDDRELDIFDRFFNRTYRNYYYVDYNDDEIQLRVEVPGKTKSDIKLSLDVDESLLKLYGKKIVDGEEKWEQLQSWRYNDVKIDTKKIKAKVENGLLTVVIPKKVKKIEEITID